MLKPYISLLVRGCIRNASSAAMPYQLLVVMRTLIRAVSRLAPDSTLFEEFTALIPFVVEVRMRRGTAAAHFLFAATETRSDGAGSCIV